MAFVTERTAKVLIGLGSGFLAGTTISSRVQAGQTALPGFQEGLTTVYIPGALAVMAFMRVPFIQMSTQKGALIVLTLLLVGSTILQVIQTQSVASISTAQGIIGTGLPFAGAAALAAA